MKKSLDHTSRRNKSAKRSEQITMKDKYRSLYEQYLYETDQDTSPDDDQSNLQSPTVCSVWPRPKFMLQINPHYSQTRSLYPKHYNIIPAINRASQGRSISQGKYLSLSSIQSEDLKKFDNSNLIQSSSAQNLDSHTNLTDFSLPIQSVSSQESNLSDHIHTPEVTISQEDFEKLKALDPQNEELASTSAAALSLKYQQHLKQLEFQKQQQLKQIKKLEELSRQQSLSQNQSNQSIDQSNEFDQSEQNGENEQTQFIDNNLSVEPMNRDLTNDALWVHEDSIALKKSKSRQNFTPQQRMQLETFFYDHIEHPYAESDDLIQLEKKTNLSKKQIRTYMTNARMRKFNGSQNPLLRKVNGKRKYCTLNCFSKMQTKNWPSGSPTPPGQLNGNQES